MSENKENRLTMGGVSGNKTMRVGRVHKKKAVEPAPEAAAAVSADEAAVKAAAAPESVEVKAAAPEKETKAEAAKVKETDAAEKKTSKSSKTKSEDTAEKSEKAKTSSRSKAKEAEASEKTPAEEKPASKSKAKTEDAPEKKTKAKKTEEVPSAEEAKKPSAEEKAAPAEDKKAEAPAPAAEAKPAKPVIDKNKISSAVVAMPETVRKSTVFVDNGRGGRYGGQGGSRPSYQGGGQRGSYQGGPRGDRSQGGGFAKDKDDEGQARPQARRAAKPKSETPLDEMKKSRANFAEKSANDRRHSDSDKNRENGRNMSGADKRRTGGQNKFTGRISEDGDFDDYSYGKKKKKKSTYIAQPVVEQTITDVQIPPFITVKDLAEGIGKKSSDVIKVLMKLGMLATINQELDFDTACLVADDFGINATLLEEVTEEDILFDDDDNKETEGLEPRPPVVVVMGHVDHGKTSLLDRIRSASVVSGEAGGITQHIGAYTVRTKGRQITFLDTPGHEAFTTMRARGANFTDIAILVVAADDGVMPQTVESINHAKAAGTEIVVAINKIDKPGANPDKVKQELANYELIPEEWGGSTIMVPVSAKQGTGIDDLLENVLLVADVLELKADPTRQAKGAVIEAKLDKARGPVATVLVQRGTLKQGDSVVCGAMIGNIRAMYDDKGKDIKKAGPSIPVEILGLPEVPEAGEMLYAVTDDKMARQLVEKRRIKQREEHMRKSSARSLENLAAQMAEGNVKELNLIIKADVQGSVEAVTQSVEKLTNEEVRVKVIHGAVGAINESDVMLADVSNAIIIGFNVRPNAIITEKAKEAGVDIKLYSVIYNAIEDIESAMKGMLAPKFEEVVLGHVEIRELFKVSGVGTIGGAYVKDGKITRNCGVRVLRDDIVIYTGTLGSLQRMKDAVKEVATGYECGLSIANYNDIKIGDIIEAFEDREVERD